ncbi:hypothetical protein ACET3Z_031833 [Daucus carota]
MMAPSMKSLTLLLLLVFSLSIPNSLSFQSDELLIEDEEFVKSPDLSRPSISPLTRKTVSDSGSDSKVQFVLEHAFGDSEFTPAGTFSARLKTWSHGGQTLTKPRFSRKDLSREDKESFKTLLEGDDFYRIRVPSNVISPPGRDYIISSVKARCLPQTGLDEHFVIHMDGVNILGVNYGSLAVCQYPRQYKLPSKWAFTSHTVLKSTEQAPRTPAFSEDIGSTEIGGEDEGVKPLERSFWAKYWMYLIPLGLIVMNAVTQAMNMPEEQAGGQPASQPQQVNGPLPRGPGSRR